MKYFLIACFLILSVSGMAQTFPKKYVDSLTAVALARKSTNPVRLNRDSVLQLLFKAPSPAARIGMFYDIVVNYDDLRPERSLYYHKLILDRARKGGDKVLEAAVQAELGFIICQNGNTSDGLKMIYESLEKAEATGNAQAIGIAYNNLGNCYPNNLQLSKQYMTKALEYARSGGDHLFTCYDLGNISTMFMREGKRDSALAYSLEGYRLAVVKNLESAMPTGLLSLSSFDNSSNLLQYYQQASQMTTTIRSDQMKSRIYRLYAVYYLKEKRMDSAFYFASQVNNIAKTSDQTNQLGALELMSGYYLALSNADSALKYVTCYYRLKDSLYGTKVMQRAQELAYTDMQRSKELAAQKAAYQNRLKFYGIGALALFLLGMAFISWRNKIKEQQARQLVQQQKDQLQQTLDQLKTMQTQLVQAEKMASLGELTAGIAHEIQNPLNFVNNFSEVSVELLTELEEEVAAGNKEEVLAISGNLKQNLQKITHHGKRADSIVKSMLQHSRQSSGHKEPTDINALADEYLRLSYHGLRAKDKSFNAILETHFDPTLAKLEIMPQDIGRVLLNLFTNAFYSVQAKKKELGSNFEPTLFVATKKSSKGVEITIKDNGTGIPQKVLEKIYQPFFTTKPTGEGTGLGLSLSYDIITKGHGGELKVETEEGQGATFIIQLPTL